MTRYAGLWFGTDPIELPQDQAFELNGEQFAANWLATSTEEERTDKAIYPIIEATKERWEEHTAPATLDWNAGTQEVTEIFTVAPMSREDFMAIGVQVLWTRYQTLLSRTLYWEPSGPNIPIANTEEGRSNLTFWGQELFKKQIGHNDTYYPNSGIGNITASITGNVLTVTAQDIRLGIGAKIFGSGITEDTWIIGYKDDAAWAGGLLGGGQYYLSEAFGSPIASQAFTVSEVIQPFFRAGDGVPFVMINEQRVPFEINAQNLLDMRAAVFVYNQELNADYKNFYDALQDLVDDVVLTDEEALEDMDIIIYTDIPDDDNWPSNGIVSPDYNQA